MNHIYIAKCLDDQQYILSSFDANILENSGYYKLCSEMFSNDLIIYLDFTLFSKQYVGNCFLNFNRGICDVANLKLYEFLQLNDKNIIQYNNIYKNLPNENPNIIKGKIEDGDVKTYFQNFHNLNLGIYPKSFGSGYFLCNKGNIKVSLINIYNENSELIEAASNFVIYNMSDKNKEHQCFGSFDVNMYDKVMYFEMTIEY